ncbi:MAG TPA: ABC transporter permease [Terriglobia bacterium]|nr:ABC transporter permease [Terriglobia bacterium]
MQSSRREAEAGAKLWPRLSRAELLSMTLHDLERSPRRTLLTILGLVIGSAAVVAVSSVGLAGRAYALQQLETLGTNFIWVSYSGPSDTAVGGGVPTSSREITEDDFQHIQNEATALAASTRVVVAFTAISSGGKTYPISLVGTDGDFARVRNLTLDEGRPLTSADVQDRRKVCVVARSLADKLYGRQPSVGRSLKIEDFNFDVVGVFRDIRTPGVETEISRDAILIPVSVARFFSNSNSIDTIYAQARSQDSVDTAVSQIRRVLVRHHGPADLYTVNTLSYFVGVVHRISIGLMLVIVVLAVIALLVGGVGILNIMTMTVSERTREIGVRLAVGARRSEIRRLFFLEALVVSVTGGVVGVLLGALGPLLVGTLFDLTMPVSPLSIAIALLVSVAVGVFFGLSPAMKAASLNPVEALRYE